MSFGPSNLEPKIPRPSKFYKAVIGEVANDIEQRVKQTRIQRFEAAHDEWRRLVGLPPVRVKAQRVAHD